MACASTDRLGGHAGAATPGERDRFGAKPLIAKRLIAKPLIAHGLELDGFFDPPGHTEASADPAGTPARDDELASPIDAVEAERAAAARAVRDR